MYEAIDHHRALRVALKVLRDMRPNAIYRFKREFRSLQGITHRNLVRLGELVEEDGSWFFTMEYIEGTDIVSYVADPQPSPTDDDQDALARYRARREKRPPKFDESRLRNSFSQLVRGLSTLHRTARAHRDVKPSNTRVTAEGRVVLLDYGLVAADQPSQLSGEVIVGTVSYMAPEQAASTPVTAAADWYSIGTMLYKILAGRLPFNGLPLQILTDKQLYEPRPPTEHVADLPSDLAQLCMDLLRTDPAERPTGEQILERLGMGPASAPEPGPELRSPMGPLFVGRTDELATLERAFDELAEQPGLPFEWEHLPQLPESGDSGDSGEMAEMGEMATASRATTFYICGNSGTGKSALIDYLTRRIEADTKKVVVLAGRCYEHETIPYKAFDGVVDRLVRYLRNLSDQKRAQLLPPQPGLLRRLFPVFRELKSATRDPLIQGSDPHTLRSQAFATLRSLFWRLSQQRHVVVVIDDIQWADEDSLLLLTELLRPPNPPRLFTLLASRVPLAELWPASLGSSPIQVREIPIGPLAPDAATELAERLLQQAGHTADPSPGDIASEAGGHPMFIAELARYATAHGDSSAAASPTGDTGRAESSRILLDNALWRRIGSLPDEAGAVMAIVALADSPLSWETIRRAANAEPAAFARSVAELRAARLIKGSVQRGAGYIEPYHDRIRESVLAHLQPAERQSYHGSIASALEAAAQSAQPAASSPRAAEDQAARRLVDRPESLRALARHLEHAGETERAARYAERAAALSSEALAFEKAAQLYRAALRLGDHDAEHERGLRLLLAEALANSGRRIEAADEYLSASRDAERRVQLTCRTRAAEYLLTTGHVERGQAVLDDLLRDMSIPAYATSRRALSGLLWNSTVVRLRGFRWHEDPDIDPDALLELDVCMSIAKYSMIDLIRGVAFHAKSLRMALALGEPARICRALAQEGAFMASMALGSRRRAIRLLAMARDIAKQSDDPYLTGWVAGTQAIAELVQGNFVDCVALLERANRFFAQSPGATWEMATANLMYIWAIAAMGRFADLQEVFDRDVRSAAQRGDRYTETYTRCYGNIVWLARDRPKDAIADLDSLPWAPSKDAYLAHNYYDLRARVEHALYAGTAARAREELRGKFDAFDRSLFAKLWFMRAEAGWLRARLALSAATDADPATRATLLAQAERQARRLERQRPRYAPVWAALIRAGVAAQRHDDPAARQALGRALDLAEERSMGFCAAAARWRLARMSPATSSSSAQETKRAEIASLCQAWMRAQGVVCPERFVEIAAPGWP